jgi:hypothetical protein
MRQRFGSQRVFVVLAVVAVAAGSVVAFAHASAPEVNLGVTLYPAPVVTAGTQTLAIVKFANVGGNSLNNVTLKVPLPASSGFLSSLSSSGCTSSDGLTVTCLVGHVAAGGSATRYVVFSAPSAAGQLTVTASATWDESLNNSTHQDTQNASATTSVVSGTDANAIGTCSSSNAPLTTAPATSGSGNQVNTAVTFSTNNQGLPCTPVSVLDDVPFTITNGTCTAKPCVGSSATLPQLPSAATVTITFDGSLFPPPGSGPNPGKFVVFEIVNPGATSGEQVPLCSTGTTTTYGTCEVGASKYGSRGIQVTLKVPGRAIDPQWFG